MEENSVKNGLKLMWQGLKMFAVCAFWIVVKSAKTALVDLAKGIVKHPILAFIIAGVMAYQFYLIATQRVERDQTAFNTYKLEQKYDSAQIAADITQYRYEHRNDTTGSN